MKTFGSVVIGYEWDIQAERDSFRALPAKKKAAADDAILAKLLVHNCVATRSRHLVFDLTDLFKSDPNTDFSNLPANLIEAKMQEVVNLLNANNLKRSTLPNGQNVVLGDGPGGQVFYIPLGVNEHRKVYGRSLSLATPATPWRLAVDVADPDDPADPAKRMVFNPRAVIHFSWGVLIPRHCMNDEERLSVLEQQSFQHLGNTNLNPHGS